MKTTRTDANRSRRRKARRAATAFGQWVRDLRVSCGVGAVDWAVRAGMSHSYVSDIERGKCRPKPDGINALSDAVSLSKSQREEFQRRASAIRPSRIAANEILALVADCPACSQRVAEALKELKKTKKDRTPVADEAPAPPECEATE